ncbi:MAG: hypothetical protein NT154_05045, partial [Verrucomicrobia bacterium]|nr:hypothetical protein [Verrucomicrobiota bacterium]
AEAFGGTEAEGRDGSLGQFGEGIGGMSDGVADGGQDVGGEVGEDGEGSGFDGGAEAVGLAEEEGRVGLTVVAFGDDFGNKHDYM